MSQKLFVLIFPLLLLISGCWSSSDDAVLPIEKPIDSVSGTNTIVNTTTSTLEDCKKTVDNYLVDSKNLTKDWKNKVEKNLNIVVDYIGRLSDGTVFDTSVESVAKACGLYNTQRNYTEWLAFTAGAGQMIPGFDKGVIGMSTNETKTITIPSKDAYGDSTISFPIDQLPIKPDGSSYKVGESIATMNGTVKIEALTNKEVTIKNNHPLAGKDLIFDITIKTIN
jgi:FKBP-type peptidyl-prolyl cis-trans isomerase 2